MTPLRADAPRDGTAELHDARSHRDPSDIDGERNWFDGLADGARDLASRNVFFLSLLVATALWALSYPVFGSVSTWYVVFVLPSEILTLLLVALLENSNRRSEQALHRKLDTFAAALADIAAASSSPEVSRHAAELQASVGLQDREGTDPA